MKKNLRMLLCISTFIFLQSSGMRNSTNKFALLAGDEHTHTQPTQSITAQTHGKKKKQSEEVQNISQQQQNNVQPKHNNEQTQQYPRSKHHNYYQRPQPVKRDRFFQDVAQTPMPVPDINKTEEFPKLQSSRSIPTHTSIPKSCIIKTQPKTIADMPQYIAKIVSIAMNNQEPYLSPEDMALAESLGQQIEQQERSSQNNHYYDNPYYSRDRFANTAECYIPTPPNDHEIYKRSQKACLKVIDSMKKGWKVHKNQAHADSTQTQSILFSNSNVNFTFLKHILDKLTSSNPEGYTAFKPTITTTIFQNYCQYKVLSIEKNGLKEAREMLGFELPEPKEVDPKITSLITKLPASYALNVHNTYIQTYFPHFNVYRLDAPTSDLTPEPITLTPKDMEIISLMHDIAEDRTTAQYIREQRMSAWTVKSTGNKLDIQDTFWGQRTRPNISNTQSRLNKLYGAVLQSLETENLTEKQQRLVDLLSEKAQEQK